MFDQLEILKSLYERFNARDMEGVLAGMHEDVIWANGMEGAMSTDAIKFAVTGLASGR